MINNKEYYIVAEIGPYSSKDDAQTIKRDLEDMELEHSIYLNNSPKLALIQLRFNIEERKKNDIQYYYWIDNSPDTQEDIGWVCNHRPNYSGRYHIFWITPIDFYDAHQRISDWHLSSGIPKKIRERFGERMESNFEFVGTLEEAHEILKRNNFIFKGVKS